jgi:putative PIG3 family NAD(P)H quinone oxidoreductase
MSNASLPAEMNVIEISEPGGPEALVPGTRPVPEAAPGEVLVKVAYAGVNGPDLVQRRGHYPPPKGASDLLGLEISGEVVAVCAGGGNWKVGDKLCALTNGGGYADYCAVDARHCLPLPHGFSLLEAASVPETYFTVWSNVFMGAKLSRGEVFLVHGGAGGLGTTSIQLAKAIGATVVAVDSPAERCAVCKDLGADLTIDFRTDDFVETVRGEYRGADVILDIIGGPNIAKNIKASKPDGRIVQLAFNAGSKVEIDLMPVMLKRLTYTGSTLRSRTPENKAEIRDSLALNVWPMFEEGKLKPVVNRTFPLAEAAAAHAFMESAGHIGKIMLEVGGG